MKKTLLAILCAAALVTALSQPVAAAGAEPSAAPSDAGTLPSSDLLEEQMAQDPTAPYLELIRAQNEEISLVSDYIDQITELKVQAQSGGPAPEVPDEIVTYMQENNIPYTSPQDDPEGCWDKDFESLAAYQSELSQDVQTLMDEMGDAIDQHTEYVQDLMDLYLLNSLNEATAAASAPASGSFLLMALSAFIGGAGGTALVWAIVNRKKKTPAQEDEQK